MNIAIVGATGNVGRKILEVLEKKELSFDNLHLVASSKSVGKKITFKGREHEVLNLESFDFSKVKITFLTSISNILYDKILSINSCFAFLSFPNNHLKVLSSQIS